MAARKLSSLKGSDKFLFAMAQDGKRDMERWLRSKRKSKLLMAEVHKHIFELGPPTPPHKHTPRSRYRQMVGHHFYEIFRCIDTMRDIEFYIGRFPYSEAKVEKHRHLQFHVEAFLHELYILQLRLVNFVTFIQRKHCKDPRHTQVKVACDVLADFVTKAMRKAAELRGSHVHRWRLADTQLDRLNGISLYTKMPSKKIQRVFKAYYESEYRRIRKQ